MADGKALLNSDYYGRSLMRDSVRPGWSRRSFLGLAAGASGMVLAGMGAVDAASAATVQPQLASPAELASHGLMNLQGLQAEYRAALAVFPFPLPDGYEFPAESTTEASSDSDVWEVGAGRAEVYCFWQLAMVTAAHDADVAQDAAKADNLMRDLEAGYESSTRRAVITDPENYFVGQAIQAATPDAQKESGHDEPNFAPLLVFAGAVS